MHCNDIWMLRFHSGNKSFGAAKSGSCSISANTHAVLPLKSFLVKVVWYNWKYFLCNSLQNRKFSLMPSLSTKCTFARSCARLPISIDASSCKANFQNTLSNICRHVINVGLFPWQRQGRALLLRSFCRHGGGVDVSATVCGWHAFRAFYSSRWFSSTGLPASQSVYADKRNSPCSYLLGKGV